MLVKVCRGAYPAICYCKLKIIFVFQSNGSKSKNERMKIVQIHSRFRTKEWKVMVDIKEDTKKN